MKRFLIPLIVVLALPTSVFARSYAFQGKCGFLLSNSFVEKCTALFKDGILTLMPKGAPQERIFPTQIESYSLSSKESMKINEDLEKWHEIFPERTKGFLFWQRKEGIPSWVLQATSKKINQHKFIINYVDRGLNPRKAIFVLNDEGKASAMQLSLRKATGLYINQKRKPGQALGDLLAKKLVREAERKAQRLMGLCAASMYEDSEPISSELEAYVNNTIDEISIFKDYQKTAQKLDSAMNQAVAYCEGKQEKDIAEAKERERAKKAAEVALEKEKREAAFDMLGSY